MALKQSNLEEGKTHQGGFESSNSATLPGQEQQIPHNRPDFVIGVHSNELQGQRNLHPPDLTNSLSQQNQDPRQSEIQLHRRHTEFPKASPSIHP